MLVIWSYEQDRTGPICHNFGAVALREAKRVRVNDLESHGHWKRPWQECEMTLCKEMSLESDCQWYPIIICYHICMSDFIQLLLSPSELIFGKPSPSASGRVHLSQPVETERKVLQFAALKPGDETWDDVNHIVNHMSSNSNPHQNKWAPHRMELEMTQNCTKKKCNVRNIAFNSHITQIHKLCIMWI